MRCLARHACLLLGRALARAALLCAGLPCSGLLCSGLLAAGLLLVPGVVGTAWAEALRLRSGEVLDVEQVEVLGEALRVRVRAGGGTGTATLPLARVEPADLLRVLLPRTGPGDAPGHLRIARVALEAGQLALALEASARAAALDGTLLGAWSQVQEAVQARLAQDALAEVELDLRLGRPAAAHARACALLEQGLPVVPPPTEAAKARLLRDLARAALEAGTPSSPSPLPAPAGPLDVPPGLSPAWPPLPGAGGPLPSALVDADALAQRGLRAREEAALPGLAAAARDERLSEAAARLLDARRLLLAVEPGSVPGLSERLERLRLWLVATWLDLADLARAAGRPDLAFERVQAALVLDPASERAWELRRWIEQAWAATTLPPAGPAVVGGLAPAWGSVPSGLAPVPGPGPGPGSGHGSGVRRSGGSPAGSPAGSPPGSQGGAVHNPGTRR
ncbi:MAG: hypothetical protein ACKOSS_05795 [Planctomycetia bacterium]